MMNPSKLAATVLSYEKNKIDRLGRNVLSSNPRAQRVALNVSSQAEKKLKPCEKCGKNTYFTVLVIDRRAFWCGCE